MSRRRTALMAVAWTVLIVVGLAAGVAVHRLWQFRSGLEKLADRLTLDIGPESTLLYDANDNLISAIYEEHRIAVRLEEMSPHLTNAVLVTEDRRFFDHDGVDLRRIVAAFVANQRAGEIVEGGSTITQQLVRSILLDRERTYSRKLKEAVLAIRLEERYSKHDILESYLNRVYFGDGYYGVQAAAVGYFGKEVSDLDPAEAATLAAVIKGPSIYSPTKNPDACKKRRDLVLDEMRADGLLGEKELEAYRAVPVKTLLTRGDSTGMADPRHAHGAEYFRDAVTRELVEKFGADAVYTGGLRVYTTLDRNMQRLGENVIASRLRGFNKELQGALVAIDPQTGFVKAIVGGRDFHETQYNRAIDARRQPGSTFKPFIYAVALESGYSPGSLIEGLDEPIPTQQGPWLPGGEHETTSTTLRTGLALSSNRAAAHLLQQVGVHRTIDLVQRLGISSPLPAVPALALGTGEMTLYELTSAYGVFANRGVWKAPTMIRRVVDRYGREIYAAPNVERTVLSEATSYMMASMMSDVLTYGTGASAKAQGMRFHAAGKTGTSQDYADAWFVGFTPKLVAGVWFGFDKPRPIVDRGFASVVAVPAWARFMVAATRGMQDEWLDMPGSLVKVKICRLSGGLATDRCHLPVYEPAPYDPNHPELMATGGTVRQSSVYEEVMTADRVPPPCTLPHGEPAYAVPASPYDDPNLRTPAVERAVGTQLDTPPPAPTIQVTPADRPPRTPTPLPPFMTERPAPSVTTMVPTAAPKPEPKAAEVVAPKPEDKPKPADPAVANPILPSPEVKEPPTAPTAPQDPLAPIVPGAKVDKAPPPPPRRPGV